MNKMLLGMCVVAIVFAGLVRAVGAAEAHGSGMCPMAGHGDAANPMAGDGGAAKPKACPMSDGSLAKALAELDSALQSAQKAADAGDANAAATELAKAQKTLTSLKEQLKSCPMMSHGAKPVNTTCPIMGGKIDPAAVKPELTRQFNGQTIGFCCAGCPDAWDKLTDEQKQAKLGKRETPAPEPDPHGGHRH